jgi:rhodanese-related sulfurtransferase
LMYCDVGQRSTLATQISGSFGLKHASHLIGGIQAWKKAGLEVKTKDHHH